MPVAPMVRVNRANLWKNRAFPPQTPNADEATYADRRASFTKGFDHDPGTGLVADPGDFGALVAAMTGGDPAGFDALPLQAPIERRFVSPQAGLGVELIGPDPRHLEIDAAPCFASAEEAGEIVENYWMARLRDVHFADYVVGNALVDAAAAGMSALSDFRGPKIGASVTPATLFRDNLPTPIGGQPGGGNLVGPYLSQFMWLPVPFGAQMIDQRMRTVHPSIDYMTDWGDWLAVQEGRRPIPAPRDPVRRYIRNGRDLSEWVHIDQLYQAYFNACLILLAYTRPGGAPAFDAANPYLDPTATGATQDAFATFGGPHILSLVTEVATRALKAVWYQKWAVHRRLRPEAFGGRVHAHKAGLATFDVHADALGASVVQDVHDATGSYLLPMAFPEGSPMHPAYGAGHATVAGACVTILKAWFDEGTRLVDLVDPTTGGHTVPVVSSADGTTLVNYTAADAGALTIGGELNKLAANVGIGRNIAGVHWRSDHSQSIRLGERVAIGTLRDYARTYNEPFEGFRLTRFNGAQGRVTAAGFQSM